ncbi:ABC transporter permease [Nocardioides flavescens]|uniref:ABC transporter permease n=1 Tax=Nocardioides flavescens TaxID=2691959 RepID=A0A6L7F1G3_9ACTN|nr:ABC transporter permease [Nocardioides flavescens]MXG88834.1 ABC transporter permease [Nocardioides flavescens]
MSTLAPPVRRTLALTKANARLLVRNRTTFLYALVMPLVPMVIVFASGGASDAAGANAVTSVLLMAVLFPVFYNVLSQVVTRRDELVLKRLRTGEVTDREIALSIALPGVAIALAVAVVTVPVSLVAGLPLPSNPAVYLLGALVSSVVFAALAFWTAAWTRNAEAGQMTSVPVMVLAVAGTLVAAVPDRVAQVLEATPGGAMYELVRTGWYGAGGVGDAVEPLVVLAAWGVVAVSLARRSMRWEPRV